MHTLVPLRPKGSRRREPPRAPSIEKGVAIEGGLLIRSLYAARRR